MHLERQQYFIIRELNIGVCKTVCLNRINAVVTAAFFLRSIIFCFSQQSFTDFVVKCLFETLEGGTIIRSYLKTYKSLFDCSVRMFYGDDTFFDMLRFHVQCL
jgi:hypothetical protein